ncbi:MAG: hypothetical protein QOF89_5142 [Acidobacteriota bacterium]|jgi:hypothetical protein|nr:hypothetical protein [Acidobacteriota bacterium]
MSYLSGPRLHFNGFFQADVSTVNNNVRYYDIAHFKPQYQMSSSSGVSPNGGWQPEGTGIFRLVGCTITGGWLDGAAVTKDPVLGMALESSDQRVSGKLVDLDPQQQLVSEIWGMAVRLTDDRNPAYFNGQYGVAAFNNAWARQQDNSAMNDQKIGAAYQSVLEKVVWSDVNVSPLLQALQAASGDCLLSIQFNVYGYGRDPSSPRYTLGRITGTIGPASTAEPRHFVLGRQMMPNLDQSPMVPAFGVNAFQCLVDPQRCTVTADFGNALQIVNASGVLVDMGELSLAILKSSQVDDGAQVGADAIEILGQVPYLQPAWYPTTAGIQTFDYSSNPWVREHIAEQPLGVVKTVSTGAWQVLIQESLGGLYARADQYVYRLNPGETASMRLYATRYGSPIAAKLALAEDDSMIGSPGGPPIPGVPVPKIGVPLSALQYSTEVETHADGSPVLVEASANPAGPGNPRGYIDGQVYGIGYQLADPPLPANYNTSPWSFVSVLLFDLHPVPDKPTWYRDIQPILTQFGNLYPIMSHHLVDLGDYDSVVRHADILNLAFSLPVGDPNYMPVTRDLSAGRRATLLKWLNHPGEDGLPLKGVPLPVAVVPEALPQDTTAAPELDLEPIQRAGKTEFLLQLQARKNMEKGG